MFGKLIGSTEYLTGSHVIKEQDVLQLVHRVFVRMPGLTGPMV